MPEDWAVQINYKIGQDLINIRAADGPDLRGLLQEVREAAGDISETAKSLGAVQVVSQVLGGQQMPSQPAYGTPPAQPPAQAAPAAVAQDVPPEFCQHGQMIFKSGTSQKGNAYALHECPAGDKTCPTKWASKRR